MNMPNVRWSVDCSPQYTVGSRLQLELNQRPPNLASSRILFAKSLTEEKSGTHSDALGPRQFARSLKCRIRLKCAW